MGILVIRRKDKLPKLKKKIIVKKITIMSGLKEALSKAIPNLSSEAAVRRCSVKKVFLEISQNSQ